MLIGGELVIKDKGDAFVNLPLEGQNIESLFVGLLLHEVGSGIKNQFGGGILGKEGQGPFHSLSPGPGPMPLKDGFIPIMRNGVEVQIDDAPVTQTKTDGFLHKGLLKLQDVNLVQGIGIGGHGRALGKDIQTCEQSQTGIEGMIPHVTVPLRADEIQGHKKKKIADRLNDLGPRQTSGTDQFR